MAELYGVYMRGKDENTPYLAYYSTKEIARKLWPELEDVRNTTYFLDDLTHAFDAPRLLSTEYVYLVSYADRYDAPICVLDDWKSVQIHFPNTTFVALDEIGNTPYRWSGYREGKTLYTVKKVPRIAYTLP